MKSLTEILEEIQDINEGLIVTHPLVKCLDFLETWCGFDNKVRYAKLDSSKFKADVLTKLMDREFNSLIMFVNNYGYFPSHIYDSKLGGRAYRENDIKQLIDSNVPFTLKFEAKYDEILDGDGYRTIYHITDEKYKNEILKNGLCPKSKSKTSYHPDRIYFTLNKKDSYQFAYLSTSGIVNPVLFKIDLNLSPIHVKLYIDPNFKIGTGLYTMNNIHPKCITTDE